jgi:hypothetical protein
LVQDPSDDIEDRVAKENRDEIRKNGDKHPEVIKQRLLKLENKLKTKFSNCYESVRKAFLALDTDYDGYITVEDILKYFGNDTELNYSELKKLLIDKDSKKVGRIGYSDFSKWLGNAIHMSEGFYFRHDSIKNPQYDMNLENLDSFKEEDRKLAAKEVLNTGDIEYKILEKIKFQWKTLRKAFQDLTMGTRGNISRK